MTLQEHYNSIVGGKGNKAQFLKQARHLFPQHITNLLDFDTTVNVLKSKQIISEAKAGGVVGKGFDIYDWKKILSENLDAKYAPTEEYKYAVRSKYIIGFQGREDILYFKSEEEAKKYVAQKPSMREYLGTSLHESVKAEEKKVSKEVEDYRKNAYDNADMKNADNVNFNEIMKGFYLELKDPKNHDKTVDELKAMVVKNLAKDALYYTKEGMFGVEGVGYTDEAPGLKQPKEPKGKHKSSGYGDLDVDVEKVKANVQDTLGNKEAKTSMPKKVKEMPVASQNASGVKKMPMPGKEKKIKLQEGINLQESKVRSLIAKLIKEELNGDFNKWKTELYDLVMDKADLTANEIAINDDEIEEYYNEGKTPSEVYFDIWQQDAGNFWKIPLEEELEEANLGHSEIWSLEPEGRFWILTYSTMDGKKEKSFESEAEAKAWIKQNLEK